MEPPVFVDPSGLVAAAREAKRAAGLSNQEVADRLGLSRSAVALALAGHPNRDGTRRRILEELTGSPVEGPFYRVAAS